MTISSPQSITRPQVRTTGEVRALVAKHLEKGLPVNALGIEPNRPLNKSDFAFVGITPSVKRHVDYYRCSFCQVNKKFSKGRIVLSSDGLLRLIGPECWDINLDADTLVEARQDWDDYTKHERFLRLKDRMQPLLTEAITNFSMLLRDHLDLISFLDNFPRRLAKEAPQLFSLLEKAHRMNGQLQVERTVRDYTRDGRNGEAIYTFQLNTLHVVPGLRYIIGDELRWNHEIQTALSTTLSARNKIAQTEWEKKGPRNSAKLITEIEKEISLAVASAASLAAAYSEVCSFFSAGNLRGIARWAQDTDNEFVAYEGGLSLVQDALRFEPVNGGTYELRQRDDLILSLMPDLSPLHRLLNIN
jgi:hypothetical protein